MNMVCTIYSLKITTTKNIHDTKKIFVSFCIINKSATIKIWVLKQN